MWTGPQRAIIWKWKVAITLTWNDEGFIGADRVDISHCCASTNVRYKRHWSTETASVLQVLMRCDEKQQTFGLAFYIFSKLCRMVVQQLARRVDNALDVHAASWRCNNALTQVFETEKLSLSLEAHSAPALFNQHYWQTYTDAVGRKRWARLLPAHPAPSTNQKYYCL